MVLMSGSKMARNAASIINRTNTEGGNKKAGLAPRIGWYLSSNVNLIRAPQRVPVKMVNFHITQTQRTGYRATIGGV
jgi:hypothetical protein